MLVLLDYDAGINWETLEYTGFWAPVGFVRNLFFNGFHPVFPWSTFMLIGMVVGRYDLSRRRNQLRLLLVGIVMVISAELSSWWLSGKVWQLAA